MATDLASADTVSLDAAVFDTTAIDNAAVATAPGGVPVVELHGIGKTYRTSAIAFEALRDVHLRIDTGEYVAIVGPSGSGKSTLMNIIGCLDTATVGEYRLAGESVDEMDDADLAHARGRRIGFVFQQFNLLASLTAGRNVELPLAYAGIGAHERTRRAQAALERVGLADKVHNRPGELSGGQQQRVAMARALVAEPDLILADEPTGNLDSASTADILDLFDELHATGTTIVLITHEADVAKRAARLVHVHDGKVTERVIA